MSGGKNAEQWWLWPTTSDQRGQSPAYLNMCPSLWKRVGLCMCRLLHLNLYINMKFLGWDSQFLEDMLFLLWQKVWNLQNNVVSLQGNKDYPQLISNVLLTYFKFQLRTYAHVLWISLNPGSILHYGLSMTHFCTWGLVQPILPCGSQSLYWSLWTMSHPWHHAQSLYY